MITFVTRVIPNNKPKRTRNYDVRITLNKNGLGGYTTRIGFINEGFNIFNQFEYITISSPENNRIYFKESAQKEGWKISKSSGPSSICFNVSIYEKTFRAKWVGGTFKLKFDETEGYYYIERGEEENA